MYPSEARKLPLKEGLLTFQSNQQQNMTGKVVLLPTSKKKVSIMLQFQIIFTRFPNFLGKINRKYKYYAYTSKASTEKVYHQLIG